MAADNGESATLAVDHHHWGSPGSLQLNGLNKGNVAFVGRGHAPADHVSLPLHPPSSAAPKPGQMRGAEVGFPPAAKESTLQPLISQKSEIFASFYPGRSLTGTALGRKAFSTAVDGKNLPPGGRWLAAGETDEERRNLTKQMYQNKTHPQSISTPLGSPYGRIWRFLRRAGACPRRSGAFPIARS